MAIDIKKLSSRIIDLDSESDKIIALSYRGKEFLLTRSDLEELLWIKERATQAGTRLVNRDSPNEWEVVAPQKRSGFFSLGKQLGYVLDTRILTDKDIRKLNAALDDLISNKVPMSSTRTSQAGHMIKELRRVVKVPKELAAKFDELLSMYPELLDIPNKSRRGA